MSSSRPVRARQVHHRRAYWSVCCKISQDMGLAGALLQIWAGNTSGKCYTVRSSLKARHSPPRPRAGGSSSSDLKTTTGRETNRAVGTGRSAEKATGPAAPGALFLKGTFGFEMHLMI